MKRQKILVVEDEPDLLEVLEYNLTREGFRVLAARDGETGLKQARAELPDAVVLDLMLPDLAGEEVCRRLRALPGLADVPVVFLSGRADSPDLATDDLGPVDLIAKPFDPADVVATVRERLRERAS